MFRLKCAESDAEPPVVQQTSARKLVCNIDGGAGAAVQINFLPEGVKLVRHDTRITAVAAVLAR